MCRTIVSVAIWAMLSAAYADPAQLFQAIRAGDIAFLKANLATVDLNARDRRGNTLLMYAAAFGNLETVKLLIDAGVDVNARNDFDATALLWCARDQEKARLLIARGANINARSKQGRTPLMLASLLHGGSSLVGLMLSKRADANLKDNRGDTALGLAASIGEVASMRLLLANGANPEATNSKGERPIILATKSQNAEAVRMLIGTGINVNVANSSFNTVRNGPIAMIGLTPLHRASAFGPVAMVVDLLKAGADVNARDSRALTPLIFAVATEFPSLQIVRALLQAGADVNLRDSAGESALDWAAKFGYPEVLAALKKAGAKNGASSPPRKPPQTGQVEASVALARAIDLLQKTSTQFFRESGCVGCHHQPLIAQAQKSAKAAGVPVNEPAKREQLLQMKGQWLASQEEFLQSLNPGGGPNRLAENLLGLNAAGYAPDLLTDSAIVDLAEAQGEDGSWRAGEEQPRPPITESAIGATARAIGALQKYSIPARKQEFAARIERARVWLKGARAVSSEEFTMRLLGLAWAGAAIPELREAARPLLALQHDDGGWSGNPYLKSDAFSTGAALTALSESGAGRIDDAAYRRGIDYLLSTQYPDGSWYVQSRSIKFQPYFESGFPFGHDQWISSAATAWAVRAIAASIRPSAAALRQ